MADRNVNVRLQVIDGGKVKAELASVGEVGAKSLDGLAQRSQQAGQAINQLRTHEVTNLAAQLTDLGVQVASGQSFMTAMIQQGPQIAAVMGDRGVKASLVGVGTALASLITPTTAVLAGVAALGYGASIAFDAITDDADDSAKSLSRHEEIVRRIAERYGEAKDKAAEYNDQQRQIDLADSSGNAKTQAKAYAQEVERLLRNITTRVVSTDDLGNATEDPIFDVFAASVDRLRASARAGAPDVLTFRGEVARLINEAKDPAVEEFGRWLMEAAVAAQDAENRFEAASGSVRRVGDAVALTAEQIKTFKKTIEDWAKDEKLIADLNSRADTADDPRQRAINSALGRLSASATDDLRRRAAEAAGRDFDEQQAQREQEKRSREALSEARRRQNAVESEAERIYRQTRTAAEEYADTLEKLNEHLRAGRIDQETYARAVAAADEVMREANRAALDAATDAASGYKRAVRDYVESAQDMAQTTEDLMVNALGSAEDAFVEFVTTGKTEFGDLVNSMIADLARLAFRQSVAGLLSGGGGDFLGNLITGAVNMLSGGLTGGGSGNAAGYMAPGYVNNNTFAGPRAMGGQIKEGFDYLVGEKGPEVVTARRDGFVLPTEALRGAAPVNNVRIINQVSGAEVVPGPARRNSSGGVDQEFTVRRMVRDEIRAAVSDGDLDDVGAARYNWRRGDLG